jgi:6-phosphogluconolactonase (cycloisomerase 2 family)
MKRFLRLFIVVTIAAAAVLSAPALAAQASEKDHVVFVQTNDPDGNAIVAFRQRDDGTLKQAGTYRTGGKGGRAAGAESDPLASQGSLVYDQKNGLLFAVNAGSNTITVFSVKGDKLRRNQVVSSGGTFPVGFALQGKLLYVLNAGLEGSVSGFRIADGKLRPLKHSTRSLELANTNPPFFLSSPAQVGFTPNGKQLVVTTKDNALVEVFSVKSNGLLSEQPAKNPVAGVPFAFRFDRDGRLVLVNANPSSVGTYTINADNMLKARAAPVSNDQMAACWITPVRGYDYITNTASGTISQYKISGSGKVKLVNATAASGIAGPIDMTAAGNFLYVQAGLASSVQVFAVKADGSLKLIQTQRVPHGASQEGIVAT